MKLKATSIFVFLFIVNFSFGQQFVNLSNSWFIDNCCYEQGVTNCHTSRYWFEEEIQIDSVTYFKLNSNSQNSLFGEGEFYREEDGKVYMKFNETTEEVLIYDFNLMIGDQIYVGSNDDNLLVEVVTIDSVELISGEKRKRMAMGKVDDLYYTSYWIEGVGSVSTPFNTRFMFTSDCWNELNCFYQASEIEYQLGDCALTNLEDLDEKSYFISVYPNPTFEKIRIKTNQKNKVDAIGIFDINGIQVRSIFGDINQPIDVFDFAKGIYFIQLNFENEKVGFSKFIKI